MRSSNFYFIFIFFNFAKPLGVAHKVVDEVCLITTQTHRQTRYSRCEQRNHFMVASSSIQEHYTIKLQVNMREPHNVPPKMLSDPLYRPLLKDRNELGCLCLA